jgi:hypothetical protein
MKTGRILEIADAHKDKCDFVKIYVSEAHPTDEWQVYTTKDINYKQPQQLSERGACANKYVEEQLQGTDIQVFLDGMDNHAEYLYSAHPERLYVLNSHGNIVYKGGMGPFGYLPDELNDSLEGLPCP